MFGRPACGFRATIGGVWGDPLVLYAVRKCRVQGGFAVVLVGGGSFLLFLFAVPLAVGFDSATMRSPPSTGGTIFDK